MRTRFSAHTPVSTSANGVRLADIRKKRNIAVESGNQAEPPSQLILHKEVPCRYSPDYRVAMSSRDSQAQRRRPPPPLLFLTPPSPSLRRCATRSRGSRPG